MNIESKRYDVTEMYVEDKSYKAVMNFVNEKEKEGFIATNVILLYGKHGNEEDRMWYSKLTKKVQI